MNLNRCNHGIVPAHECPACDGDESLDPGSIENNIERDVDAKEAGRLEERARIVAWLREMAPDDDDGPCWLWTAEQIEKVEHRR